ncbi:MAG: pectate lyase [Prevotella sp.]|nr:pectate lyase [Prevotella sp.]
MRNILVKSALVALTAFCAVEANAQNNVALDQSQNQLNLELQSGETKYYNTSAIKSIDINDGNVSVAVGSATDKYDGNVKTVRFAKASIINQDGKVEIIEAKGWLESAYIKWKPLTGAVSYNVYVKGGQYADWTKIDYQLVRNYGTYGRADVVGLKAGSYELKVVPVDGTNAEKADAANQASNLEVRNYNRSGFAHKGFSGIGAYNDDGTLKSNAKVLYVTKNTAKTISTNVAGAQSNPCVGLQTIIDAYQKGGDTTPITFRIIGTVDKDDLDHISSSEEGIQIKGKNKDSELNITIEGIGEDATFAHVGFLARNAKSVEFRNFGIIRCMDDGISLDTDNSNIWIHHIDVFYGKSSGGDHAKGDGAIDVKTNSKYVTVDNCHYWDTGKTNMFGMKSESGPNYITYHHNWFDHSDSRHPRVRTMSVHVWNNYFDNVAKYGVGATSGASVFVENNYFLKTKKPILSSNQGTDALGSGTFSGEAGGMIKAYGNYFDRTAVNFKYYTQNNPTTTGYDAYETANRNDKVPATEVTKDGGTAYNNFDTDASLMYDYTPDAAEDVPGVVTGYWGAGRLNHGDISFTFSDNVGNDDTDSAVNSQLSSLIDSYKSSLVGIFDGENIGGGDNPGGGDDPTPGPGDEPTPEGTILCSFDGAPSVSMFTAADNYGDGKITYEGVYYKKGEKMDSKGSITFTPTKNYDMTIVLGTAKGGKDVSINGTKTTVSGTENTDGKYYELQPIEVTANTAYTITKGSAESLVMIIKLVPKE